MNKKLNISERLACFIREHMTNYYSQQLILFFTTHPKARFSEAAIIHALGQNAGRNALLKALAELVDKKLITTYNKNKVLFYSLPDNKSLQNVLMEFAGLDVSQQNLALEQSRVEPVEKETGSLVSRFWGASCVQLPQLL
jgi:hypothetical protein